MPALKKSDKVRVELGPTKKPKAINQKVLKAANEVVQLAVPLPLPKVRAAAKVVKSATRTILKTPEKRSTIIKQTDKQIKKINKKKGK